MRFSSNTEGMHYNHYNLITRLILLRKSNLRVLLYIPHDVLTSFAVEESVMYTSQLNKEKLASVGIEGPDKLCQTTDI